MNAQSLIRLTGIGLFILSLNIVTAQEIIEPNTPVTVTLGDNPAWLTYSGQADEQITITTLTTASDTVPDTTLEILYPDGQRLDYNDDTILPDGNLKGDARIDNLLLPIDGDYQIRIDSFNGVTAGNVDVLLTQSDTTPDTLTSDEHTIVHGDIKFGFPLTTTIDLKANATVSIIARDISGTLDPVLRVYAEDDLLAFNDDHNTDNPTLDVLDAHISALTLTDDTRLSIVVTDFLGRTGTVELIVTVDD